MNLRKDILGVLIPSITIAVFAVLMVSSLSRLRTIERDMRLEATQNMLWVITRAHVGSLQLQHAAAMQVDGIDGEQPMDRIFNNFLSYYNVLNDGPQRRQIDKMGLSSPLDGIKAQPGELRRLTTDLSVGDDLALARIRALLAPYDAALIRAANMAMVAEWDTVGSGLDHAREQVSAILASMAVIAIAGAAMTFYLIRASQRARSRARLLEREKAFSQLLVTSSSEGIVATDREGRCTLWNDAAVALFDIGPQDALHKPLKSISGFFGAKSVQDAIAQALDGKSRVLDGLPLFADLETSPLYAELRCFPLRSEANIVGSILLISDVTEQYLAERELSQRRDYLEDQIQLRTQELNAALSRERTTTEIYRNFAAMISHQFRTPLAIVDAALHRLMRRAGDLTTEQIVERSGQARSAIARAVRLVETTLDVVRLDNGQLQKQTGPSDLDILISNAVKQQSREAPQRQFKYTSIGSVIVDCDPVHAEHVIANMLSNAAKYASLGSDIKIVSELVDKQAMCRVINDGCIDENDRAHIFKRYFRGHNAGTKDGVGLGLYMARGLAQLQGGEIWLEEDSCNQVVFTFALPLAEHTLQYPSIDGATR